MYELIYLNLVVLATPILENLESSNELINFYNNICHWCLFKYNSTVELLFHFWKKNYCKP